MKVILTEVSRQRLKSVINFLYYIQGAPKTSVKKIRKELLEATKSLKNDPEIYQKEEELESLGKDHRRIIVRNYKVIFRIEGTIVYVTDFFDTRQDPAKMKG